MKYKIYKDCFDNEPIGSIEIEPEDLHLLINQDLKVSAVAFEIVDRKEPEIKLFLQTNIKPNDIKKQLLSDIELLQSKINRAVERELKYISYALRSDPSYGYDTSKVRQKDSDVGGK